MSKHVYFIGLGGVGMLCLADWALAHGYTVSGSDGVSSPATERLAADGVKVHYGSDPAAIPSDVTEAVITSAITPGSPSYAELEELERRGIPITKRAVWTGKITRQMRTIAVSGTHGKTTTTAMIGWILDKAGLDPTVFVGGSLAAWGERTRLGKGPWLVLEADEFDRSFHQFKPEIAVILNIEADHLDYYTKGLPEIVHSFRRFLRNLPHRTGMVVAYGKDKQIRMASKGFAYKFRWYDETTLWPGLTLSVPGTHNLLNATAAARVAHELGVDAETIKEALATFPGVGRRFESCGQFDKAEWYDDYAHHPTEIKATLQALAARFPNQPTTVVFQPHQKARTQHLLAEFGRAFDQYPPTRLILAPIYEVPGREEPLTVTSGSIAEQIALKAPAGMEVQVAATNEELQKLVEAAASQPGILLTMGAGTIRKLAEGWRS